LPWWEPEPAETPAADDSNNADTTQDNVIGYLYHEREQELDKTPPAPAAKPADPIKKMRILTQNESL